MGATEACRGAPFEFSRAGMSSGTPPEREMRRDRVRRRVAANRPRRRRPESPRAPPRVYVSSLRYIGLIVSVET